MTKRNTKPCEKCGRQISLSNHGIHVGRCKGKLKTLNSNPFKMLKEWKNESGMYICPFCKQEFGRGITGHIWRMHTEEGKNHVFSGQRGGGWNKGLTKETDSRVKNNSETLKKRFASGEIIPNFLGKHHSEETKKKLSERSGGYRRGSGRGKHGWYKGYWCDSSWELAWIIYHLEHDIKFERNKQGFEYEFEGVKHEYFPDFKMEDGSYVEIKRYMTDKNKAKHKSFPGKLCLITNDEIQPFLKYAKERYGDDYIQLYEGKPYEKYVTPKESYWNSRRELREKRNQERVELIKNSGIDFTIHGWKQRVAELLNIKHSPAGRFIKKYCPELIETSYVKGRDNKHPKFVRKHTKEEWKGIYLEKTLKNIETIRKSGVNFSRRGWLKKLSLLMGISKKGVKDLMQNHCRDILSRAYLMPK